MAQTRLNSFDDASSESKGWDPKANLKRQRSPDLNLSDDDAPVVKRTRQNTPSQHEHADLPVATHNEVDLPIYRGDTRPSSPAAEKSKTGLPAAPTDPDISKLDNNAAGALMKQVSKQLSFLRVTTKDDPAPKTVSEDVDEDQGDSADFDNEELDRAATPVPAETEDTPPTPRPRTRRVSMHERSFCQPLHVPSSQDFDRSSSPGPEPSAGGAPFVDADEPDEVSSSQESNKTTSTSSEETPDDHEPEW